MKIRIRKRDFMWLVEVPDVIVPRYGPVVYTFHTFHGACSWAAWYLKRGGTSA